MKRLALAVVLAACGGPGTTGQPTITLSPGTSTLEVEVEGLRSEKGSLDCALFNAPDGFPGPSPIVGGAHQLAASTRPMRCTFDALPAGTYAVSVQHDEDGDGELDTNFVGVPTEGYGVTNNVYPGTRAPTFEEAQVSIGDGEQHTFTITLKY